MTHRAIFLDRDGTINFDSGYIKDPSSVVILEGVAEGIRKLRNEYGFKVIIVSNQAGISRGLMTIEDVESVNEKIKSLLAEEDAIIEAVYYCPYHPDFDPPEKTICRKPSPFMIVQAAKDHKINLSESYMIGDRWGDIMSGLDAGVKSILLTSDILQEEISTLLSQGKKPNFIAANFKDACEYIIKDLSGGN
jgi:D,D-heptose 1,7-bisphosphate phosphatase